MFILTDVNSIERVPIDLKKESKDKIIAIDHHMVNANSGVSPKNRYIDKKSSSASEIVAILLNQFDIKYRSCIAKFLLLGIYLDTQFFKNIEDNTNTMDVIAILQHKAKLSEIKKYFKKNFMEDRKLHHLIDTTEFVTDTIAILKGTETELFKQEELASAANYVIDGYADYAFAIGKISDGIVSISARAQANNKQEINISKIMTSLGGGGSLTSAATRFENQTISEVEKVLKKELIREPISI